MIRIRKAMPEDIAAVVQLEKQCFSVPWSYESFNFELESHDAWFSVAESEGRIVGFAILHRFVDEGELFNVAVAEQERRQKIGDRLIDNMFRGASVMGIERIFLEVRKSNDPALALYRKHGFEVCGVRKNYYVAPKEDAVLMEARVPEERKEDKA